ncbi:hypothetical protein [Mycobacterium deserti]|uniref:Uncharacterized protein n=1 Tax=Mycobacterium deserti TaxID=2978347 RepID=A0ABT2M7U8_9MYCO|nr:hypothetical protein [Mycobacterium deserti]MCT7658341.1 hypothetical protein [Mycobacterium deserti]
MIFVVKALRKVSATEVAYVCFLLTFVALGTFVYALAARSAAVWVLGAGFIVLMVAMVAGFRIGARKRAASNDSGIEIEGANVWARPLRREQIDRYLQSYRGISESHEHLLQAVATPLGEPSKTMERQAA